MSKDHDATPEGEDRARFTRALLGDLQALEQMLEAGKIESGVRRIGAEQEVFLVDDGLNPAPMAPEILKQVRDDRLTTEIARFNLEVNLNPRVFCGSCLSEMEKELESLLATTRMAARGHGADILLIGILPTLRQADLTAENMAPVPRYLALDRAVREERGDKFRVRIKGLDELDVVHHNVMLESCNTSFQVHFQVGPDEFVRVYNAAQLATAPVLACAANSPVLLQHRLWSETRIALFPESVDDRATPQKVRGDPPRVHFGDDWVRESVLEIFREDIARCRALLTGEYADDSMDVLRRGDIPELRTLCFFNGTVYRWNRPCYGLTDGVAHLRIENRTLPAGPTVIDEVANAAFFFGLLVAVAGRHPRLETALPFDEVKRNFLRAARHGLDAQLAWLDGGRHPACELLLRDLLPLARVGLREARIDAHDVDRYLGVIEARVEKKRNGASWILDSIASIEPQGTADLRYRSVTAAMLAAQRRGAPVHEWPLATLPDAKFRWKDSFATVGQVMSTNPLRVRPGDVVDLPASLMDWERARYVAVERANGELVGLISSWSLLRVLTREHSSGRPVLVDDVMDESPITVEADTPITHAVELMKEHHAGCLPVVEDGRLIGMLTHDDLVEIARHLLQEGAPAHGTGSG